MLELVSEEHRLISSAVGSALSEVVEADRALFFADESRVEPARVKACMDSLGLFEQIDPEAPVASSVVQSLIAFESGRVCLPFPILEGLCAAYLCSIAETRQSDLSANIHTLPTLLADEDLPRFDGQKLHGRAKAVPFASLAQKIVVAANHDGARVFVMVDAVSDRMLTRQCVEEHYPVCDLDLEGIGAEVLLQGTERDKFERVCLNASLAAAAEIAGASTQLFEITRQYLLSREQFGAPLAVNQALKHRMADHHVHLRSLEMLISYAAAALDAGAEEAPSLVQAAKSLAGTFGKDAAEDMLQLHGAIAYTTEYPLHLYLRRILRLGTSFGSTFEQNERLYREFGNGQADAGI